MRLSLPRLASIALALGLGFSGCDDRQLSTAAPTENPAATGTLAFRLADTLVQLIRQSSDSVRIEASRTGQTTRFATGPIGGSVRLDDLAPGVWTLRVATFDTLQALGWYGETTVEIKGGITVQAVLVLRRASGSVDVRIVLDSVPPPTDTLRMTVKPSKGSLPGYLPILRSWRTDSGLFVLTRFYCQGAVVRQSIDSGTTVLRFGSNPDKILPCTEPANAYTLVFVPWTQCGWVALLDATGKGPLLVGPNCDTAKPLVIDTVTTPWIEGNPADYKRLPIEGAWRNDRGIFILTEYDYFQPVAVHNLMQSSVPPRLFLAGKPFVTGLPVARKRHVVFVPYTRTDDVIVATLNNDTSILLKGSESDPPVGIDTIQVPYIQGNPEAYEGIPVDSAWRGANGIYIATRYDDFLPVVIAKPTATRFPQEIVLVGKPIKTAVAVPNEPHVVFVPFPSDWPVGVGNLLNDGVIQLPGLVVPPKDSSFVRYSVTKRDGLSGDTETLTLTADGKLVRLSFNSRFDSGPLVETRSLDQDTLATIRSILERTSTRHPGGIPTITASGCPSDAPIHSRVVDYANGTASSMKWSLTEYCGELPASWTALDPVDRILRQAFRVLLPVGWEPLRLE